MKFSLSWLRQYVDVTLSATELADALTMAGLEVEGLTDRYDFLNSVVAGRIDTITPHPNADRLRLCAVSAGSETVHLVCGAQNITEGMMVPLALPGTEMPDGKVLQAGVIRGEASNGMLCSEKELGLGEGKSGIMALDQSVTPGTPLNQVLSLSDPVFEIGLTPNRPDCASIIGIAREVAAIQGTTVRIPEVSFSETAEDVQKHTSVEILDADKCPRYAAKLIFDVTVAPSPAWLQDRLKSIDLKPINNIVDITNFVMMETGQPLHAFDFDQLAGRRIVVKTAGDGDKFTSLDSKARTMDSEMLMICDADKPVGIAGVMGGENSEISDASKHVLLESAYFAPDSIRRTAKTLGLSTDASYRFERGVDPLGTTYAIERAAALMEELGSGKKVSGTLDVNPKPAVPVTLTLSVSATNRLLGTEIPTDTIAGCLTALGFGVTVMDKDTLSVDVPSFRVDVSRPQDLMEEVARHHGYDNIPVSAPAITADTRPLSPARELRIRTRRIFTGLGFSEALNYSFISDTACDKLELATDDPRRRHVAILNPLSEDQGVMRTSILPGLLENMRRNTGQQEKNLKLFEVGNVFLPQDGEVLPKEVETLGALWTGTKSAGHWQSKSEPCDFFDLKGAVESFLADLAIQDVSFAPADPSNAPYLRKGYGAEIRVAGTPVGVMGEMHPSVLKNFDLKQTAFVLELSLAELLSRLGGTRQYTQLPVFPSTSRDITLIVAGDTAAGELIGSIHAMDEPLMENSWVFDVYEGKPIPEGKRSVSIRSVFRAQDRTLDDETVNAAHKRISDHLMQKFDVELPR